VLSASWALESRRYRSDTAAKEIVVFAPTVRTPRTGDPASRLVRVPRFARRTAACRQCGRIIMLGLLSCVMICDRCHLNPATNHWTFIAPATGQQIPQHLCKSCLDELLRPHPEISQELRDAETEGRPAEIKSVPPGLIPESFLKLMRKRDEM